MAGGHCSVVLVYIHCPIWVFSDFLLGLPLLQAPLLALLELKHWNVLVIYSFLILILICLWFTLFFQDVAHFLQFLSEFLTFCGMVSFVPFLGSVRRIVKLLGNESHDQLLCLLVVEGCYLMVARRSLVLISSFLGSCLAGLCQLCVVHELVLNFSQLVSFISQTLLTISKILKVDFFQFMLTLVTLTFAAVFFLLSFGSFTISLDLSLFSVIYGM